MLSGLHWRHGAANHRGHPDTSFYGRGQLGFGRRVLRALGSTTLEDLPREIMHGALCEPCDAGKIYSSAFNMSESDTGPKRVCSGTMYLHVLQPQDAGARTTWVSVGPDPVTITTT